MEMVWIGGGLLYGNRTTVEAVRPQQCEPIIVHASRKMICGADTSNPPPGGSQTLAQIQAILLSHYANLVPLAP
ncbi:MAG: hypothetical protein IRY94_17890 [Rhodospirillaceae bacterium]|nr:hypothetical protein [Rhodospirillaceae bacterium]